MNRFVGAVIVSALAIGAAHAQQRAEGGWHGGGGGMWRMADANGDGVVTRAEYQAAVDARFARMDANGDGILSPDERPGPGRHAMGGPEAARMATPGDGGASATPPSASAGVTRDQFRAQAMRRFDAADGNHDGRIDAAEMQAMMAQFHAGAGGGTPPPPPAPSAARQ